MPLRTGTNTVADLLTQKADTVITKDVDVIVRILQEDNANYSRIVEDGLATLSEPSTERTGKTGNSIDGIMQEADEFARIAAQKTTAGALIGFPLRKMMFATGWTSDFRESATPADYALSNAQGQKADMARLQAELGKAFFNPTNYDFEDYTTDHVVLKVKALMNGDSSAIQNGPTGAAFDGATHTHFNANATLTAAAVLDTITDVTEHGYTKKLQLYINVADEAAFRLLAGFVPYPDPRLLQNATAQASQTLVITDVTSDNRAIGIFGAAEVWVKPWVPANYLLVVDTGSDQKPLRRRIPLKNPGFQFKAEIEAFPLSAKYFEHKYGFGAVNRLVSAVLKFNNASYSAPVFTY